MNTQSKTTEKTVVAGSGDPRSNVLRELPKSDDVVFKLAGDFRRSKNGYMIYPRVRLSNDDFIIDPNTGLERMIRLLHGIQTIYADEQGDVDEKMAYRLSVGNGLEFNNGHLRVHSYEKTKIAFLRSYNRNGSNPNRKPFSKVIFYELNTGEKQTEDFDFELLRQKARQVAFESTYEDMVYHATYLNIILRDEVGNNLSENGIRAKYVKYADSNPKHFLNTAGTNDLRFNYIVKELIIQNKIIIDKNKLTASWSTGKVITNIPEEQDPAEFLSRYALSPEGEKFKKRISDIDINKI